jgi:hypothetical protein
MVHVFLLLSFSSPGTKFTRYLAFDCFETSFSSSLLSCGSSFQTVWKHGLISNEKTKGGVMLAWLVCGSCTVCNLFVEMQHAPDRSPCLSLTCDTESIHGSEIENAHVNRGGCHYPFETTVKHFHTLEVDSHMVEASIPRPKSPTRSPEHDDHDIKISIAIAYISKLHPVPSTPEGRSNKCPSIHNPSILLQKRHAHHPRASPAKAQHASAIARDRHIAALHKAQDKKKKRKRKEKLKRLKSLLACSLSCFHAFFDAPNINVNAQGGGVKYLTRAGAILLPKLLQKSIKDKNHVEKVTL